jgi:two-component system response regulator YesN
MLRVLVCDDEDNICHLIVKLIDWEHLDMQLAGTAHTGREALSMIVSASPDIVVTDIRMPDIGGIDMINQAQQLGVNTKFIVISGYQYFEYAHGVLRAGVTDYLLKPINGEELNAALRRISQEISRESEKQAHISDMESSISSIREVERRLFIKNVIMGNSMLYTSYQPEICGLNFTGDCFGTMVFCFDGSAGSEAAVSQATDALMRKTEELLGTGNFSCLRDIVTQQQQNCLICVYNYAEKHEGVVRSYLDDIYFSCHKTVCGFSEMHVTMGIGRTVKAMSALSQSVSSALEAVHARIALGVDRVIRDDDLPVVFGAPAVLSQTDAGRLGSCIDLCDQEALLPMLGELFSAVNEAGSNPLSCYEFCREVLEVFRKRVAASSYGSAEGNAIYERAESSLGLVWRREQAQRLLTDAFSEYFDAVRENRSYQNDQPIAMAKEYIAGHYADECSLDDVANHVHLTPNYLSSLFKKKTGVAMNNYIALFRINKAKLLLKETDEPIQDIAGSVGYRDLKHFRRVFKQNVGISPAKYRSLYK